MPEALLAWFSHWLPLVQGFAALASIGGAALSWKYAIKAQTAREDMTQNIIASRLLEEIEKALSEARAFRDSAADIEGKPDATKYRISSAQNKRLFEEVAAQVRAATSYLRKRPDNWSSLLERLAEAAFDPNPIRLESAIRLMTLVAADLRMAAATREILPNQ